METELPEPEPNPFDDRARIDAGRRARGRAGAEYLGSFTSVGGSLRTVFMSAETGVKYGGYESKDFQTVLRASKRRIAAPFRVCGGDALTIGFGDNPRVLVVRLGSGDIVFVPAHYFDEQEPPRKRLLDVLSAGAIGKLTKVGSARITGDAAVVLWAPAIAEGLDARAIRALARKPKPIHEEGGGGTQVGLAFALRRGTYGLWREAVPDEDMYQNCYWLTPAGQSPPRFSSAGRRS